MPPYDPDFVWYPRPRAGAPRAGLLRAAVLGGAVAAAAWALGNETPVTTGIQFAALFALGWLERGPWERGA